MRVFRHISVIVAVCVLWSWLGGLVESPACGQTCGLWLDGPATPDFPPNATVYRLATSGTNLFAIVSPRPVDGEQVWRYSAAAPSGWVNLGWDAAAFGSPGAIAVHDGQIGVASARVTGQSGNSNIWEIAVRVHDGSAWHVAASGTRLYSRETMMTNLVSLNIRDLINHAGRWHIAARLSVPGLVIGFSSSGILYRFDGAGGALEDFASSEARSCTLCLDPRDFTALESTNGVLYLGGAFATVFFSGGGSVSAASLAAWNGTAWQAIVGGSPNGSVKGLFVQPSIVAFPTLITYGDFTQVGSVSANRIASYQPFSQTWGALGTGLSSTPIGATSVAGLGGPLDIDLVVAGVTSAGGVPVDGFARWTGSAWQEFGDPGVGGIVTSVVTLSGAVIAGGTGMSSAGEPLYGIARWSGTAWTPLGTGGVNGPVRAMISAPDGVYAGGAFTVMDGVPASHVARRTEAGWQAVGSGVDGEVLALARFGSDIVVGGTFENAGSVHATYVAAWNGSAWRALGAGLNDSVRALTVWNNRLVAVGDFGFSGSTPVTGVAQWNGSAWSAVDPAFNLVDVHAATVHKNELYIGGEEPVDVRRFTAGSFQIVGGGVNGNVYGLASLAGSLYVGGDFTTVGNNLAHRRVARWTGSQWLGLNQGANDFAFGAVRSLATTSDTLFVAGDFQVNTTSGAALNAARWNGVSWLGLPDGWPDAPVFASTLHQSRYWIGGAFAQVGSALSSKVAQWSSTPVFTRQPLPVSVCAKGGTKNAVFSVELAPEAGVTLRWHRNGTALNDGLRISGSATAELTIFAVTPGDNGAYSCIATDACMGSTASDGALLSVGDCCLADFNSDAFVNSQDLFDFLTAFFALDPRADVNHDAFVNSQDLFDFLAAFFGGC